MDTIENKALNLLSNLKINELPIPIKKIVKSLKIELTSYNLGCDISGVCVIENDKARIGFNPLESEVRQRFTIAHELGHYYLKHYKDNNGLFVDNVKVMFRRQGATSNEMKQEREANSFAASILMPSNLVEIEYNQIINKDPFLTDDKIVHQLANKFRVSEIAMTYRLINLRYIHRSF